MAVLLRQLGLHFLVSLLLITFTEHFTQAIDDYTFGCGSTLDLMNAQRRSGLLKVGLPESFAAFQNPSVDNHCDITIFFTSSHNLLLELYYVDIIPLSNEQGCTTGLEVFEQSGLKSLYGGRVCAEAWEWEQRHRESRQEKRVATNSPVIFRLTSMGPYKGNGFKVHFNEFRPTIPCYAQEFRCQEFQRCVHDDLACDGWDDCGDDSDEEEDAGCGLLTACEICAVIIGSVFIVASIAIIVVFVVTYRRRKLDYYANKNGSVWTPYTVQRSESKTPIAHDNYSLPDSTITFPRRYNSQESMSKSAFSRHTRRDSDNDSIDKLELEKSDRFSYNKTPDNMSEKSSRSAKNRGRLGDNRLGSTTKDPGSVNGYGSKERLSDRDKGRRDRSRDRYYRDRDYRRDDSDRDTPRSDDEDRDRDRGYRRRSSRERSRDRDYSYSDDSDYERERRRRRRRRRSYDRYSDEDSDSEYERERRRRRRSRDRYSRDRCDDRDRYDSDRDRKSEKDFDRESDRPRRRSSRERERHRDSYEDDRDKEKYSGDDSRDRKGFDDSSRGEKPGKDREDRERDQYYNTDKPDSRGGRRSAERKPYGDGEDVVSDRAQDRPTESQPSRYENRRSRSRENVRPARDEEIAPPPKSEELRQRAPADNYPRRPPAMNAAPTGNDANNSGTAEPVRTYRRRSSDERRGRRRSRGPQPSDEYAPPEYEDVAVLPELAGGYKEAAV
ncbi:DEAD-box ATP-dependent RNA helicase 42 [Aplysia californica]|uniref:DEAD-box ATP-dependent RNA helicase 42 n=1 Tax=Aplysia californica TaxID=6500 RepID=A0ABM0JVQ7_APLCA|nr:DEAD-box ATP-dependent RNA helicase 42 [Aplysia californica]